MIDSLDVAMLPDYEVLKAVFPFLDGIDLMSCMAVCKLWRDSARDDYLWKCLCAKRWPSICKCTTPPSVSYHTLYQTFFKRHHRRTLLPPRLSFEQLEFFIDIWGEDKLIFSEVVPGPVFLFSIRVPPPGMSENLKGSQHKMTLLIDHSFTVPLCQNVSVSVLVRRKDSNMVACIIRRSSFNYIDRTGCRAFALDYLDFSPMYPFISDIRAWISLLFMDYGNKGIMEVFGFEMDFCDAANTEEEVLLLLDMLDWK